jgi:hypothetical protein
MPPLSAPIFLADIAVARLCMYCAGHLVARLCFDADGIFFILSQQHDWGGIQFLDLGWTFVSALVVELDSSHYACCGGKG